jgi:hypothetical protein
VGAGTHRGSQVISADPRSSAAHERRARTTRQNDAPERRAGDDSARRWRHVRIARAGGPNATALRRRRSHVTPVRNGRAAVVDVVMARAARASAAPNHRSGAFATGSTSLHEAFEPRNRAGVTGHRIACSEIGVRPARRSPSRSCAHREAGGMSRPPLRDGTSRRTCLRRR